MSDEASLPSPSFDRTVRRPTRSNAVTPQSVGSQQSQQSSEARWNSFQSLESYLSQPPNRVPSPFFVVEMPSPTANVEWPPPSPVNNDRSPTANVEWPPPSPVNNDRSPTANVEWPPPSPVNNDRSPDNNDWWPPSPDEGNDDQPLWLKRKWWFFQNWPPPSIANYRQYWPQNRVNNGQWVVQAERLFQLRVRPQLMNGSHSPVRITVGHQHETFCCSVCCRVLRTRRAWDSPCPGLFSVLAGVNFVCLSCRWVMPTVTEMRRHFDVCPRIVGHRRSNRYSHLCGTCGTILVGTQWEIENHIFSMHGRIATLETWSKTMQLVVNYRLAYNSRRCLHACFGCERINHQMSTVHPLDAACSMCRNDDLSYFCDTCNTIFSCTQTQFSQHLYSYEHLLLGHRHIIGR